MRRTLSFFLFLLLIPGIAPAGPSVTGLRHWTAPDHTRVVLDVDGDYRFEVSTRVAPERIVIDIPEAGFRCGTEAHGVDDTLIRRVRCNALRSGAQVVLDLKQEFEYRYFALAAIPGRKAQRIVIDVFPRTRGEGGHGQIPEPETPAPPSPFGRDAVVIIDAGHGGEDPGAILHGKQEKEITLDIALRLQRRLEKMRGFRPILTRRGDYTLDLASRRRIADRAKGDLLISIHVNTAPSSAASGVEVFTLSTRGASSRRARAIADLENSADLIGGVHPKASREEVKLVLDESLKTVLRRSRLFGEVLREVGTRAPGIRSSRMLKRANFGVCKVVTMPAVLVEVGFLSNRHDWELLTGSKGRQQCADWIAEALDTYFHRYADTLYDPLFASEEKLVYRVKRGDNLSRIAQRFGISVASLARMNHLNRLDYLEVGQKLLIAKEISPPLVHRVQRGDTLSAIAQRYGVSVGELIAKNGIVRRNYLRVGQKLLIRDAGGEARGD